MISMLQGHVFYIKNLVFTTNRPWRITIKRNISRCLSINLRRWEKSWKPRTGPLSLVGTLQIWSQNSQHVNAAWPILSCLRKSMLKNTWIRTNWLVMTRSHVYKNTKVYLCSCLLYWIANKKQFFLSQLPQKHFAIWWSCQEQSSTQACPARMAFLSKKKRWKILGMKV